MIDATKSNWRDELRSECISEARGSDEEEEDRDEDEEENNVELVKEVVTPKEALGLIDRLMCAGLTDSEIDGLTRLSRRLEGDVLRNKQQMPIDKYFKKC